MQPHLKWHKLLHALWRSQQKGPAKEKSLIRCTLGLTFKPPTFFPHCINMFREVLRKTATFVVYGNNWYVFIPAVESVYCAVRSGPLNTTDYFLSLKGYSEDLKCAQWYITFLLSNFFKPALNGMAIKWHIILYFSEK